MNLTKKIALFYLKSKKINEKFKGHLPLCDLKDAELSIYMSQFFHYHFLQISKCTAIAGCESSLGNNARQWHKYAAGKKFIAKLFLILFNYSVSTSTIGFLLIK
ncbi:hypothetical protein BpHYR1_000238 [Brachionus plicatilis]|uniref:Uncharacterized protein n=1 Tax=Brachionus plicatilis TaxID=10195 RepID=A0A3M7PEN8_BRAPC|nr:hypothetical protein BpHYR1_000238 [Brachionus plicatilis]